MDLIQTVLNYYGPRKRDCVMGCEVTFKQSSAVGAGGVLAEDLSAVAHGPRPDQWPVALQCPVLGAAHLHDVFGAQPLEDGEEETHICRGPEDDMLVVLLSYSHGAGVMAVVLPNVTVNMIATDAPSSCHCLFHR